MSPRTPGFAGRIRAWLAPLLALAAFGCGEPSQPLRPDSAALKRVLLDQHLRHWLAATPTPNGAFRTQFRRDWSPEGNAGPTLSAQSQLVALFAIGHELTDDRAYLDAARAGADFLLERMRDPLGPGWFERVHLDGKPHMQQKGTIGHAHALLGLAHMYRASRDSRYLEGARRIWHDAKLYLRAPKGGYLKFVGRDLKIPPWPITHRQDGLLAVFEALLAMHELTGESEWLEDARPIANLVTERLLANGRFGSYVPEVFDDAWTPVAPDKNGHADLGTQAAWATLLAIAAERGMSPGYRGVGERLLEFVLKVGYDEKSGGVWSRAHYDGTPMRTGKGWWQQAQFLRMLAHYGMRHARHDLSKPYAKTLDFVHREFVDPANGGWFSAPAAHCNDKDCLNLQVGPGYAIAMMYLEPLRAQGEWPPAAAPAATTK